MVVNFLENYKGLLLGVFWNGLSTPGDVVWAYSNLLRQYVFWERCMSPFNPNSSTKYVCCPLFLF